MPSAGPRILVVQNDADKGLGRLEPGLLEAGAALDVRMAHDELPSVDGYDGLIVLPGLADPIDDDPAVHRARAAIARAVELDRPVLGLCLGGQLLAQVLGGEVGPSTVEQGYHEVRTTAAAADDPLLGGAPPAYASFHAHAFGFTAPPGATVLLENEVGVQAARLGGCWAFQCHPETPVAWADALAAGIRGHAPDWMLAGTPTFFARHGVDPDLLEREAREADAVAQAVADGIARGFAGVCRG